MKSMTGFAHCDLELGSAKGTLTLKSYNNRYLDLAISLPSRLAGLEQRIRDFLSAHIARGKVECSLRLRREQEMGTPTFNVDAASALTKQLRKLADACGLSPEIPLPLVAGFPGIADFGDSIDEQSLWESFLPYL
ncbi:MAG: hypothetical protein QHH01_03610, partial [Spirochaetales bacterium]|nr:hypothetical protein [Spirochaetales bacterium]